MKRSFTEKWHLRWAKYVIGLPAWSFPTMPGMQREPGQKGEGEHARETEKRTASKWVCLVLQRPSRNHHCSRLPVSSFLWVMLSLGHLPSLRLPAKLGWFCWKSTHPPMGWCDAAVPRYLPVTWPQQQQWLWERSQQDSQKELANIIEAWKIPVSASLLSYSKNNPLFSVSQGSLFNRSYATLLNKIKHSYSLHMLLNTATLK